MTKGRPEFSERPFVMQINTSGYWTVAFPDEELVVAAGDITVPLLDGAESLPLPPVMPVVLFVAESCGAADVALAEEALPSWRLAGSDTAGEAGAGVTVALAGGAGRAGAEGSSSGISRMVDCRVVFAEVTIL